MSQHVRERSRELRFVQAVKSSVEHATAASNKGRRLLLRLLRDEAGSYIVPMTIVMPALVGFAGLGTEGGLWLYQHQSVQSAADSAAVSAAIALGGGASGINTQAEAITATYGFVNGANGATVTVNNPPHSGSHTSDGNAIEVIVTRQQPRLLSGLFGSTPAAISGRAVALRSGGTCLLALNPTANSAINASGGAITNVVGCSIFSDSNSNSSISLSGGAQISALSASAVGGVTQTGGATLTTTQGITTHATPLADPYSDVPLPSYSTCSGSLNYSGSTVQTISPGTYCGMNFSSNAQITMSPGTYILRGNLNVSGNVVLTGNGVTLVFISNANAQFTGTSRVTLDAPTTGATAGMVFFGDRAMSVGTNFTLAGGSSFLFTGAIYLPRANVQISGGSQTSTPRCNQVVADKINLSGNGTFANSCAGTGARAIGASARLAE
jgi:Putative Flp pilus-assembly TadE/G-like